MGLLVGQWGTASWCREALSHLQHSVDSMDNIFSFEPKINELIFFPTSELP